MRGVVRSAETRMAGRVERKGIFERSFHVGRAVLSAMKSPIRRYCTVLPPWSVTEGAKHLEGGPLPDLRDGNSRGGGRMLQGSVVK